MSSHEIGPMCPQCGSAMVQRMARTGRNAGHSFWGCSRYPKCKGTLDMGEPKAAIASTAPAAPPSAGSFSEAAGPWVAPRLEDSARVLFLSGGGRLGLEEQALANAAVPVTAQNLCNWCLIDRSEQALVPPQSSIHTAQPLAVARKLLTRGRRPVVSPFVEQEIIASAGVPYGIESSAHTSDIFFEVTQRQHRPTVREEIVFALAATSPGVDEPRDWCLDSEEERRFLSELVPSLLGPEALAYLHPQVPFVNLLGAGDERFANARVDFVLSAPGITPLVIELDGQQHRETTAADAERDQALRAAGLDVVRLSVKDVRAGTGPGFEVIAAAWKARTTPAQTPADWAVALLWAPALVTRVQLAIIHAIDHGILTPGAGLWQIRVVERDVPGSLAAVQDLHDVLHHLERLYGCTLLPNAIHVQCFSGRGTAEATFGAPGNPQHGGAEDHLDLDVSVFHSYIGTLAHPTDGVAPDWGAEPLYELRSANIPRLVDPPPCAAPPTTLAHPDADSLTFFLRYIFRKQEFRDGQLEAVTRSLAGEDTVVLLPTGAGKSLIYQLAGLLLPGVTMVVDPIVSLIEDQLYNLRRYGIDRAVGISSQIEDPQARQQALYAFGRGDFFFCFVAPERLQTPQFRAQCRSLVTFAAVNLWVVDEAHCVSEWGHDFRTAYLNLGRVARDLGQCGDYVPPLIALTGTASRGVLRDVQRELQITGLDAVISPRSFDRPELHFEIVTAPSSAKSAALNGALQRLMRTWGMDSASFFSPKGRATMGGLVFCPHINGEHGIVQIAQSLRASIKTEVKIYGGTAPKGNDRRAWSREKSANALRFKEDEFSLLVCTKAFGMGIDKPNIRYTIHYGIPGSLESFYQEAGRAGRDRQPAHSYVMFSNDQPDKVRRMLDPDLSLEQVRGMRAAGGRSEEDDVGRMLFFHLNAFSGVDEELRQTVATLDRLGSVSDRTICKFSYADEEQKGTLEKAIHRLHLMGIVEDYTLDFSGRQFELQVNPPTRERVTEALISYVQGYSIQKTRWAQQTLARGPAAEGAFVRYAARVLIEFIYDVVEKARRTALREMWSLAADCKSDAEIRSRLLEYLQESKFTKTVEEMVSSGALDRVALGAVLRQIAVPSDAGEVRGATIRMLESQPDHPGLLVLRGLLEAIIQPDAEVDLQQFVTAGLRSLEHRYAATRAEVLNTKTWLVAETGEILPSSRGVIARACVDDDVDCARMILQRHVEPEVVLPAARVVVGSLAGQLTQLADAVL